MLDLSGVLLEVMVLGLQKLVLLHDAEELVEENSYLGLVGEGILVLDKVLHDLI